MSIIGLACAKAAWATQSRAGGLGPVVGPIPVSEAAALNSAAVKINRGSFSAAETIFEGALGHSGRQVVTVGQVLARLFWE
jgi:hypothetical protein